MFGKIACFVLLVGGFLTVARSQNVTNTTTNVGAPGAIAATVCLAPRRREIETLPIVKSPTGSYPQKEITKQIAAQKLHKDIHNAKLAIGFDMGISGPATIAAHGPTWTDTCPAVIRYYTIPRFVSYQNKVCWVLRPWYQHRLRYAYCRYRKCAYVRSSIGPGFALDPYCVSSNWKTYWFYIWCPGPSKIYRRSISLPQCCSCKRLRC